MPRAVAVAAQPKTAAPTALRSTEPAGVAALFTDLWLRSDAAQAGSSTAQAVHALAPSVDLPTRSGTFAQSVARTVAVRSAQQSDGSWSVVVAAQFTVRDSGGGSGATGSGATSVVRYFAVPVVAADTGGSGAYTVTAAPAEVAGPGTAVVPDSPFGNPLPADGALVSSLGEFFTAYLSGVGEVDRYLSPGTKLTAVSGSGYRSVVIDQAAADSGTAGAAVPGDGTRVRVQVHVTAKDSGGDQWPLVYILAMTARSGRWEVTALEAGAPPAGTAKASPQPTGSTTVGGGK
jgi:hypothetical protein